MSYEMNSDVNKTIAGLFADAKNIQILCSIYENEVAADIIANLLDMDETEVVQRLEMLFEESFVNRRHEGNGTVYSMTNPKVCDSILSLRDSIEHRREF